MKVIGITGGVGSGKSELLTYIGHKYNCTILFADQLAHETILPGGKCYQPMIEVLSEDVLNSDGTINKSKMAEKIFQKGELREKVNGMIHPAVKEMILNKIKELRSEKKKDFLFIEAALLIEDGYMNIVDEMWYIYAEDKVRRQRLKDSRSYPDDKIEAIMKTQLSDETFRKNCKVIINNSTSLIRAYKQIDNELEVNLNGR